MGARGVRNSELDAAFQVGGRYRSGSGRRSGCSGALAHIPWNRKMTVVVCQDCGEHVFTITGWSDLDHCPACGRTLASQDSIERGVHEELQREARRFARPEKDVERRRKPAPETPASPR